MTGPEIIGYETDNVRVWSSPPMPEDVRINAEGIWIPTIEIGFDGRPYEDERKLGLEEIDGFMRYYGMKRVYRERDFKATLSNNFEGCSL